jgi:diguanylate cyclase (GGDEF)-like protein
MLGYRSTDAVLTICQNNAAKSIEIIDINETATALTGYEKADVASKPFADILPARISSLLEEYVEYEADANDVGMVLSKAMSFSLLCKDKKEHAFRMKVVLAPSNNHKMEFRLVLQSLSGQRRDDSAVLAIAESFKGHEVLDVKLGLPDKASLEKNIEIVSHHNNNSTLRSSLLMLQLDHYEELEHQYGAETVTHCLQHIATLSRNSLRAYDVVGVISERRLAILLLDISPDATRVVANRLRWQMAANAFVLPDNSTLALSVSLVFSKVGGRASDTTLTSRCESALDALGEDVTNVLQEVVEAKK